MPQILDSTPIRRKPNLLDTRIDDEIVALDVDGGQCYGMNLVASEVWELLSQCTTVEAITRELCVLFEVDMESCLDEVRALVIRFQNDGLIMQCSPAELIR